MEQHLQLLSDGATASRLTHTHAPVRPAIPGPTKEPPTRKSWCRPADHARPSPARPAVAPTEPDHNRPKSPIHGFWCRRMPALSPVCGSVARGVVPFVGGVGVLRRCMIGGRVRGSRGGQIAIQLLADSAALLGRGETLPVLILGGTGICGCPRPWHHPSAQSNRCELRSECGQPILTLSVLRGCARRLGTVRATNSHVPVQRCVRRCRSRFFG